MKAMNFSVPLCFAMLFILVFTLTSCSNQTIQITSTQTEGLENPTGINPNQVRFSWKMESDERNQFQSAYQIGVASSSEKLNADDFDVWNSGKVDSEQSTLVRYYGQTLKPGEKYYWKVKVWDSKGIKSEWSQTSNFITGLSEKSDWSDAQWIGYNEMDPEDRIVPGMHMPSYDKEWKNKKHGNYILPLLRKDFEVKKGLKSAIVFISGLGQYQLDLNGEKVGDYFLAPGWTEYSEFSLYNTYDITDLLMEGVNAAGVWLGNGFFNVPNERYRKLLSAYGNPMMICKIKLEYEDGTTETVISDPTWKTKPGPITFSSIFSGETFNANLEPDGWNKAGFDDTTWKDAVEVSPPSNSLVAEVGYPVKIMDTIGVSSIKKINEENESWLYDFGQNASGIIRIKIKGKKGDSIRFYPGELVDKENKVMQGATGKPYFFTYILKGDGEETWQPKFTYYGFRYVQVVGANPQGENAASDAPKILELKLLHNRNSAPEVGKFETSFELFNRIDTLIKWAIRSNVQSVTTDCPHREKLGWLEQTYLMGGGIHYNYDVYNLYCKIVDDMIQAQTPEGLVPAIVPEYTLFDFANGDFRDSPEWGIASVALPWRIYKWYGDTIPMNKAWKMMTDYVEYLKSKSESHILDHGLGDWYDLGPNSPGYAQLTPRSLTATASYFYAVKLLSRMAAILEKDEEAQFYAEWSNEIKDAFNQKFYDPNTKIYSTGSQTAIAMPLVLGLADEKDKEAVFQTLVESIKNSDKALTAGDIGFHYLVMALMENGASDLIYEMNARDDVPGYGYQLKKGATALTESWQALERVSNNHLMLGHLMEWFYSGLGGISQTENSVAYNEIQIAPQFVDSIQSASSQYETPYGTIKTSWERRAEGINLSIAIPFNTNAVLKFPKMGENQITESGNSLHQAEGILKLESKNNQQIIKIGSGRYNFILSR